MSQKVWIDQTLCTGDGLCAEIVPSIFIMHDDGLAYVKNVDETGWVRRVDEFGHAEAEPRLKGSEGLAEVPDDLLTATQEAADECPGECIFIVEEL